MIGEGGERLVGVPLAALLLGGVRDGDDRPQVDGLFDEDRIGGNIRLGELATELEDELGSELGKASQLDERPRESDIVVVD